MLELVFLYIATVIIFHVIIYIECKCFKVDESSYMWMAWIPIFNLLVSVTIAFAMLHDYAKLKKLKYNPFYWYSEFINKYYKGY